MLKEGQPDREACTVCSCFGFKVLRRYRGNVDFFRELKLVECTDCGLVRAHPIPSELELARYNASYWTNAHGEVEDGASRVARAFRAGMAKVRVANLFDYANKVDVDINSVLEIGPGDGAFAQRLLAEVTKCQYSVVEADVSRHARLASRGIAVVTDLNSLPSQSFDVLVLSHVVEHVADPHELLTGLLALLRPGGIIYVDVPCRDDLHKEEDEPHIYFFDKRTLSSLLKRLPVAHTSVRYFGIPLSRLPVRRTRLFASLFRMRNLLIRWCFALEFGHRTGFSSFDSCLERAVLRPFEPDAEHNEPSWWLRAFATRVA